MDLTLKKTASQIQFWGLFGPFVALVTLMVLLMNSTEHGIYLSVAILAGIIVCWRWQVRGFLVSCAGLAVLYFFRYDSISAEDHLWHIGMNLAIMLALAITALSYQEIAEVFENSHQETSDHLNLLIEQEHRWKETHDMLKLEHKKLSDSLQVVRAEATDKELQLNLLVAEEQLWKEAQASLLEERAELNRVLDTTKADVSAKEAQIRSYFELVDSARQEVVRVNLQHEKLLQELLQKQHAISVIQEQLYESQEVVKLLSSSRNVAENFEEKLQAKNHEIHILKESLSNAEERLKRSLDAVQIAQKGDVVENATNDQTIQQLMNERNSLAIAFEHLQSQLELAEQARLALEQENVSLKNTVSDYSLESEAKTKRLAELEQSHAKLLAFEGSLEADLQANQLLKEERDILQTKYLAVSQEFEEFKVQSAESRIFKELSLLEKIEQISINEKALYAEKEQLKAVNQSLEVLLQEKQAEISDALASHSKALESKVESLESQANAMAFEKLQLEENIQRLKQDLKTKEKDLTEALHAQESAYQAQLSALQGRIQKLQDDNQRLETQVDQTKQDLKTALQQTELHSAGKVKIYEAQIESFAADKRKLEEEREGLVQQISLLREGLREKEKTVQAQIARYEQQARVLLEEKEALKASLETLNVNVSRKAKDVKNAEKQEVPANQRKLEGMLNQLREQFNEKSKVLDQTRQELFFAREELARLHKEQEEGLIEGASVMENYLLKVMEDSQVTSDELNQEIAALTALVDALIRQG